MSENKAVKECAEAIHEAYLYADDFLSGDRIEKIILSHFPEPIYAGSEDKVAIGLRTLQHLADSQAAWIEEAKNILKNWVDGTSAWKLEQQIEKVLAESPCRSLAENNAKVIEECAEKLNGHTITGPTTSDILYNNGIRHCVAELHRRAADLRDGQEKEGK